MADYTQHSSIAINGADVPFKNGTVSDIAAGVAVKLDATVVPSANALGGVLPTSSDAGFIGITLTPIPAGKNGIVRLLGAAVSTADGAITYGDTLDASNGGKVTAHAAGKVQAGRALNTAADTFPVLVWVCPATNA